MDKPFCCGEKYMKRQTTISLPNLNKSEGLDFHVIGNEDLENMFQRCFIPITDVYHLQKPRTETYG